MNRKLLSMISIKIYVLSALLIPTLTFSNDEQNDSRPQKRWQFVTEATQGKYGVTRITCRLLVGDPADNTQEEAARLTEKFLPRKETVACLALGRDAEMHLRADFQQARSIFAQRYEEKLKDKLLKGAQLRANFGIGPSLYDNDNAN